MGTEPLNAALLQKPAPLKSDAAAVPAFLEAEPV